jgi:hypothetical protein
MLKCSRDMSQPHRIIVATLSQTGRRLVGIMDFSIEGYKFERDTGRRSEHARLITAPDQGGCSASGCFCGSDPSGSHVSRSLRFVDP